MTWTLAYNGTTQSLEDWGISGLRRRLVNQAPDEVTFQMPGLDIDQDPTFSAGDSITIYRDGVQWFVGRVVQVPVVGSGGSEDHAYRIEGPWWYFDKLVFEQTWYLATDPSDEDSSIEGGHKSRVLLNQGFNGSALTTGAQIAEAVAWAIANGAPLQATTSTTSATSNGRVVYSADASGWPNTEVSIAEAQDVTVAEVIRKTLRWHPDAVTWFDYSTTPPTFHVGTRSGLSAETVAITEAEDISITPRSDLVVPAVCLRFEQQQTVDAVSWVSVTKQIAPPAAIDTNGDLKTAYRFGALVATIDLMGATSISESVIIHTESLAAAQSVTEASRIAWWKARIPWLNDPLIGDLTIGVATREGSLDYELTDGVVMPWMDYTVEDDTIEAYCSYRVRDVTTDLDLGPKIVNRRLSIRVTATNAPSGTYRRNAVDDPGEAIPQGLATQLYSALGTLQYEGDVILTESECSSDIGLGNTLNLSRGRAAWATMSALIQSVEEDIQAGQTRIRFGPAAHLGPQDLVELLRVNRLRLIRTRLSTRDTGQGGNQQKLSPAELYPQQRPSAGSGRWESLGMRDPNETDTRVDHTPTESTYRRPTAGANWYSVYGHGGLTLNSNEGQTILGQPYTSAGAIVGGLDVNATGQQMRLRLQDAVDADGNRSNVSFQNVRVPVVDGTGAVVGYNDILLLSGNSIFRPL